MKYDFLFIYEVFPRELESVILLQLELERRGKTVAVERRPFTDIMTLRKKYYNNVHTVLVPTVYSEEVMYSVFFICGQVPQVINMQWEQVSSYSSEEETTGGRSMFPQGFCKEAVELCWGEKPKANLLRAGMDAQKCVITGPVHMDFLRDRFRSYYKNRDELFQEFGLNPERRVLLFISSFSLAAPPERLRQYLVDIEGSDYIDEWTKFSLESQATILDWFDKLLSEHPEIDLIYRPHPTEFDSIYLTEMRKKHANFFVISDYSVKQWIITVDKVYVWFSTSSAEIYFSAIPFSILRPLAVTHDREFPIFDGAEFITDYSSLIGKLNDNGEIPLNKTAMKAYYDFQDKESYIRVCDALERMTPDKTYNVNWSGKVFIQFKERLNKELPKMKLMPFYIKILHVADKINQKTGWSLLKARVVRYKEAREHSLMMFDKDADVWLKRVPEITEKLRGIVYIEGH